MLHSTHVFKDNTEIDMHQLAGQLINEDVRTMPIAYPQHVANDTRDSHTAGIVQAHAKPRHGLTVSFGKEMPHDGSEASHQVVEFLWQVGMIKILRLDLFEIFA